MFSHRANNLLARADEQSTVLVHRQFLFISHTNLKKKRLICNKV